MNRFASEHPDFDGDQYDALAEYEARLGDEVDRKIKARKERLAFGEDFEDHPTIDVDTLERQKANAGPREQALETPEERGRNRDGEDA